MGSGGCPQSWLFALIGQTLQSLIVHNLSFQYHVMQLLDRFGCFKVKEHQIAVYSMLDGGTVGESHSLRL